MTTLVVLGLFGLMVAAPCLVAVVNTREAGEEVEEAAVAAPATARRKASVSTSRPRPTSRSMPYAPSTPNPAPLPDWLPVRNPLPEPFASRPMTLQERAAKAKSDAVIAQELARQAHWAALAATAQAAALRADAAEEEALRAGQEAQDAIFAAERVFGPDYMPEIYSSLELPQSRVNRRQAA